MTQGVISVFRNYNKAQLVVGAGSFTSSPTRLFQLEMTSTKSRNRESFVDWTEEKENESWISHWERSKHLLNAYPVSLSGLGTVPLHSLHFIPLDLRYRVVNHAHWVPIFISSFLKNKDDHYHSHFTDEKTDLSSAPSQSWWGWDRSPGLPLFYNPMRQAIKKHSVGTSLAVQWLKLHLPMQGGVGSVLGWGAKIPHISVAKKPKHKRETIV